MSAGNIENRPHVGTWTLNNKLIVQHTPDCLVYINGSLTIPGAMEVNPAGQNTTASKKTRKIDIQPFITSVSVEAGVEPGGASATVSLSIPTHTGVSILRDAKQVFHPGLEVHIYMRGYFPARGLFRFETDQVEREDGTGFHKAEWSEETGSPAMPKPKDTLYSLREGYRADDFAAHGHFAEHGKASEQMSRTASAMEALAVYMERAAKTSGISTGVRGRNGNWGAPAARRPFPNCTVRVYDPNAGTHSRNSKKAAKTSQHHQGTAVDIQAEVVCPNGTKVQIHPSEIVGAVVGAAEAGLIPFGGLGFYSKGGDTRGSATHHAGHWGDNPHWDWRGGHGNHMHYRGNEHHGTWTNRFKAQAWNAPKEAPKGAQGWSWFGPRTSRDRQGPGGVWAYGKATSDNGYANWGGKYTENTRVDRWGRTNRAAMAHWRTQDANGLPNAHQIHEARYTAGAPDVTIRKVAPPSGPSGAVPVFKQGEKTAAERKKYRDETKGGTRQAKKPTDDLMTYPYYHVFHGVVTQADVNWSGGFQTATLNCASMLHFWEYQNMSTNASMLGARPTNSKLKMSLAGHNFTGMHPYEIIYTLHHETAGSAGGVGFAIRNKTNASANVMGESLFSLQIKYWEARFASSMIQLRMHGFTGQLFNAAQASFLSRLSNSKLNTLFKKRFPGMSPPSNAKNIFSAAAFLGLIAPRKGASVMKTRDDETKATEGDTSGIGSGSGGRQYGSTGQNTPEMNVFDMIPYVKDINAMGQIQLFESTYESKLDIANKVCEVTGFEFYQDVDGDFVFKPPMYNLDTASSRVYRIEDIDLIDCNVSEKEPACTYMTAKGSHWKNMTGTGVDNEWGVRGQYIDYRLVAQFGWRPASFETSYYTNPKSMFWASVNRLTLKNIDINSATATIPLRPELRPGYPVFIPYLSAYYYCPNFSHSWAAGSRCTTSLTLTAKRSKFFAPGIAQETGIDAIKLGQTILPPKPLVAVSDKVPAMAEMVGFPNVVMALDPKQINPLFLVVGSDIGDISDPDMLVSLLEFAVRNNNVCIKGTDAEAPNFGLAAGTNWYKFKMSDDPKPAGTWYAFTIGGGGGGNIEALTDGRNTTSGSAYDLLIAARKYTSTRQSLADGTSGQGAARQALQEASSREGEANLEYQNAAAALRNVQSKSFPTQAKKDAAVAKASADVETARQKLEAAKSAREAASKQASDRQKEQLEELNKDDGIKLLLQLISTAGETFQTPRLGNEQGEFYADHRSAGNLLDLLSDKKAIFTNGSLPGYYRYYSEAHPDPKEQGGEFHFREDGSRWSGDKGMFSTPRGGWQFVRETEAKMLPDNPLQKEDTHLAWKSGGVQRGMFVMTGNPNDERLGTTTSAPYCRLMSTGEIMNLSFQVHQNNRKTNTTGQAVWVPPSDVKTGIKKGLKSSLTKRKYYNWSGMESVYDYVAKLIEKALKFEYKAASDSAHKNPGVAMFKTLGASFPTNLAEMKAPHIGLRRGQKIFKAFANSQAMLDRSGQLEFNDMKTTPAGCKPGYSTNYIYGSKKKLQWNLAENVWDRVSELIAADYNRAAEYYGYKYGHSTDDGVKKLRDAIKSLNAVIKHILPKSNLTKFQPKNTVKKSVVATERDFIVSPVFPVSDAKGYTVIGSHPYGRGIGILPDSMMDQLAFADPLQAIDSDIVQKYVRAVRDGTLNETTGVLSPSASGQNLSEVPDPSAPGGKSKIGAELELIRALRETYSNAQLLDFGLATINGNKLEIHLASYFATKSETVQRLPVLNQAYSLADLSQSAVSQLSEATNLRTAEANILYEAMTTDFMAIATQPSTLSGSTAGGAAQQDTAARLQAAAKVPAHLTGPDRLPDSSMSFQSLLKERDWKNYQDALRGMAPVDFDRDELFTNITRSASSVWALYGGDAEALMDTPEMRAAKANFDAAVGDLNEKADALKKHLKDNGEEPYVAPPEEESFDNDTSRWDRDGD